MMTLKNRKQRLCRLDAWRAVTSIALAMSALVACGPNVPRSPAADGGTISDAGPPRIAGEWGLNDVSILLPLPASSNDASVIRLDMATSSGVLLSRETFESIAIFQDVEAGGLESFENWAMVSTRIEPCFPALRFIEEAPEKCRRQIRLVFQPIAEHPDDGSVLAIDSAIHLLFDFDAADFDAAFFDWAELRSLRDDELLSTPLDISQALLSPDRGDGYGSALRALLAKHLGPDRLMQIAVMRATGLSWEFSAVHREDGDFVAMEIPNVSPLFGEFAQVYSTLTPRDAFRIEPASETNEGLEALSGTETGELGGEWDLTAPQGQVDIAIALTLEIDNPTAEFHPDSLDCAACHIATRLRERARSVLGGEPVDTGAYVNTAFDLLLPASPNVSGNGMSVRAFGYSGSFSPSLRLLPEPAISQRTVNESAEIAEFFSSLSNSPINGR